MRTMRLEHVTSGYFLYLTLCQLKEAICNCFSILHSALLTSMRYFIFLQVFHVLRLGEGQDITALALNKDNTNLLVSTDNNQLTIFTDPSVSST